MKLLSKEEVTKNKGLERKLEIDQGVSLAKKVDVLRETAAKEETNLAKFRSESLKSIKSEIDALVGERTVLERQIEALDEQKRLAQIPLTAEWEMVKEKNTQVNHEIEKLDQKGMELLEKGVNLTIREMEIEVEEARIADRSQIMVKNVAETDENRRKSEQMFIEIEHEKEENQLYFERKNDELLSREAQIAVREREVDLASKKNEKDRKEITNQRILLRDREQTLERELIRQKRK